MIAAPWPSQKLCCLDKVLGSLLESGKGEVLREEVVNEFKPSLLFAFSGKRGHAKVPIRKDRTFVCGLNSCSQGEGAICVGGKIFSDLFHEDEDELSV